MARLSTESPLTTAIAWIPAIAIAAYFIGGVLPPILHGLGVHGVAEVFTSTYAHTCHQIADRTIGLAGYPMGFCARCTGLYGALAVCSVLVLVTARSTPISRWLFVMFCLPALADLALGTAGVFATPNYGRLITGALAGIGLTYFTYPRLVEAVRYSLAPSPSSA